MEKNLDNKRRWRSRTVGFRVSEEEGKLLDNLVALSGLSKQDYILKRLERCSDDNDDNDELLYTIQVVAETMKGLKGDN